MQPAASVPDPQLGASYLGDGRCRFLVWAPHRNRVDLHLLDPQERTVEMAPVGDGCWEVTAAGVFPGARYLYRLDAACERPDPASRHQPEGVHGPSAVVDPGFEWEDASWPGIPLPRYAIYELHVGAFTPEGTFEAAIAHLPELVDLGVTAIELMPVAQFPGSRNWGYDGVLPFAVQDSYGGPRGLKRLVNACHRAGLAVILDVVYNHLGPEGNCLWDYGPYFTDRYKTAWGPAMNLDGPESDHVRRFFLENAVYWLRECHVDALRLDAVHAMPDASAITFLEDLAAMVESERHATRRRIHLIAESDLNNARLVRGRALGGAGLDAQWSDDFHHALHALLTGERSGYYADFAPIEGPAPLGYLVKALREGYVYSGQYSRHRRRRHGNSPAGIPAHRFVVCLQNHDQVGNRMMGDRLATLISPDRLKLAAGVLLLSPFLPLIFMGEEYGETNPFLYFTSHGDPELAEAVRAGRKAEFASFGWEREPPDPQDEAAFLASKLDRRRVAAGWHAELRSLYRTLLHLRKSLPPLRSTSKGRLLVEAYEQERVLYLQRAADRHQLFAVFGFGEKPATVRLPVPPGRWRARLVVASGPHVLPDAIESGGQVALAAPAEGFALYVKEAP